MFPTGGNALTMLDDDMAPPVPIGFNFEFFCFYYTQVRICSNGFLTFDIFSMINTANTPYPQSLPNPAICNEVIAYNWNDLDPSVGGTITYTTIGTSPNQIFVLTYSNIPLWNFNPFLVNSGQIVLYETTNVIEIHTKSALNNGWLPITQGIENLGGTTAMWTPGRNYSLWSVSPSQSDAYRFSPFTAPSPTAVTGQTLLCQGLPETYTVSPVPGANSYYWTLPAGWSGNSTTSTIPSTVQSTGNIQVSAMYTCGISAPFVYPVTVKPSPVVNIAQLSPSSLCSGTTVTISVTGATSYTLQPGNIFSTTGFTSVPAISTVFSVTGTDTSGCASQTPAVGGVTVIPSPTIVVNSGYICNGETFTMIPSGADQYSFSTVFSQVSPTPGIYSYSVYGIANNGCVSSPAISQLTVYAPPQLTVTAARYFMCTFETNTLTATGAVNYTWTAGGSGNTTTISPNFTTTFSVSGTDAHGCMGAGSVLVKVSGCTGIEALPEKRLAVYPNPSNGRFILDVPYGLKAMLYNSNGDQLQLFEITAGSVMDLTGYPPGIYILVARNEVELYATRLIIAGH
jgi:hypothetical protein